MVRLTLRQRIELIEHHEKNGGTLLSTARQYNVTITAVHKILKNKSVIVKQYNVQKDGRAKRFALSEHAVIDCEVNKWYTQQRSVANFGGVTKWELRKIVNTVAKEYKINFQITTGWLKEFVKKNDVVLKVVTRKSDINKAKISYKKCFVEKRERKGFKLKPVENKYNCKNSVDNIKNAASKNLLSRKRIININKQNSTKLNSGDTTKDSNKNLKRSDDSSSTKEQQNSRGSAKLCFKKDQGTTQGFSNLNQLEEFDNLNKTSKEKQIKKLGLPNKIDLNSKKRASKFFNLKRGSGTEINLKSKNGAHTNQAIQNRRGRPKSSKRDQEGRQVLPEPSDTANAGIKNLKSGDNIDTSPKKTPEITPVISKFNGSAKNNTNDCNVSSKVDRIKKHNLGRLRSIGITPRNKSISTESFYNLADSNVKSHSRTINERNGRENNFDHPEKIVLRPRKDPGDTLDHSKPSDVFAKRNDKFISSDVDKPIPAVAQIIKKIGRLPKSSPKKHVEDIKPDIDNKLKPSDNANHSQDGSIRNKPGRTTSVNLRIPKKERESGTKIILDSNKVVNKTDDSLKCSNNSIKDSAVTGQLKKNIGGRPRNTDIKPEKNKTAYAVRKTRGILKVLKNNLKPSITLKVTRLTSKGQWKVNRASRCDGKKKMRNPKSDSLKKSDENKVLENGSLKTYEVVNKVNLNNNYAASVIQDGGDKEKDVFEFKEDGEDAGILPIKRKRTIIDLKSKKITPHPVKAFRSRTNGIVNTSVFERQNNNGINRSNNTRLCKAEDKINSTNNLSIHGVESLSLGKRTRLSERSHLSAKKNVVASRKRERKSENISTDENNSTDDNLIDVFKNSEIVKTTSHIFTPKGTPDVKPDFEENMSIEFTPKKPSTKSNSAQRLKYNVFHRSKRRSSRINTSQSNTNPDESDKNVNRFQKPKKIFSNSLREPNVLTDHLNNDCCSENNDVDLDVTDYCVAVEKGNVVEIIVDRSKYLAEELVTDDKPNTPKIDIISDIKIIAGSTAIIKNKLLSDRSSQNFKTTQQNAVEQIEDIINAPATRTMETQTSPPTRNEQRSVVGPSCHSIDEPWSNLFIELESDLSADDLVTKINEIDFQYDSDPFKDVKIHVHSGYEGEEEESYEYDDEDDDVPSSQGQAMPPPNQMQQPSNNMQTGYRPPMPPTGRAPAPRGPQPGVPRMPGGPRGPQTNLRAPGARPRAPMVRLRGTGPQPVRGQARPRMTGPQNGIRPTNQTSPAKRTPEQNNALQAKRKKLDVLTPSDKDDDDCQVICMQPKNTDGGLPQIESVQGAESVENSIMHLSDSITLSVRNPPPKPVVSPVKSDAKAVANILATRGITVTASAKAKEIASPVKQAPALPTALSLNGAVSIVASKNATPPKPAASENLPTVDLTDDSASASSPTKNRPGLPYRCDLCPAQYPNAMGLSKHRQTYHKTTSGMCELGVPLINIKQPGIMQKLSQMGINNYIPLPSAGPEGTYALPIISTKSPGNVSALGATQMLSLGPVRAIPRPGAASNTNAPKK